ncbi:MAG TPA: DUF1269 domain-containing protein [Thermomicrobiales bacterium]|nr:DUF1269 domain-containing protein [Thermomicrobiales bacterium]
MTETPIHLVAIAYDDEFKADEARILVRRAQSEGLADVLETAVVVHERNGRKRLTQDIDLEGKPRAAGPRIGISAPLATAVQPLIFVGTAAGEVVGRLTDTGILTSDLKGAAKELRPGTSALFVLAHEAVPRGALAKRLSHLGGQIMRTTLSPATNDELVWILQTTPDALARQGRWRRGRNGRPRRE